MAGPIPLIEWQLAFFRCGDSKVKAYKAVMGALMTYADNHSLTARPKIETLVNDTGMPRSTVIRHLSACVELGWLVRVQRGGPGRATVYRLAVP